MLSIDCTYCGALNQAAAQSCVVCDDDLALQTAVNGNDQNGEWQPVIDPDQPLPSFAPFGLDSAISETLSLFRSNLWLITRIVVVTVAPFEIFRALNLADIADQWELMAWSLFLGGLCKVLVAPALIYALTKVILTGKEPGVHESYRWGLTKLAKLAICTMIVAVLQTLGYAFLIIPGIIVYLVFLLVYPIAVLEKGSVTEVFARCIELTRGNWPQIFAAQIILGILLLFISLVGDLFTDGVTFWPVTATVAIVTEILNQAVTVMSLVIYLSVPRGSNNGGPIVLSLTK